jgi:phthiocerol/phenolphthiocerol synthesis type-I polyketide synthase C
VFIDLMALFADGTLQPLPHRTFDAADIATAFATCRPRATSARSSSPSRPISIRWGPRKPSGRRWRLRADATYVVSGGLSGFGLRTAWWLVEHGARHLVLAEPARCGRHARAAQILR